MKGLDLQTRLFYPAKLPFRIKGQIKSFPDKKKLQEFIITKPLSYEMLKNLFKKKKKIKPMNNKMAKNKLSKQEEQRQNHGHRECFILARGEAGTGE